MLALPVWLFVADVFSARADAPDFPATMLAAREKVLELHNASPRPELRNEVKAHHPDLLATFEACAGLPWMTWATATNGVAPELQALKKLSAAEPPASASTALLRQFAAAYGQLTVR